MADNAEPISQNPEVTTVWVRSGRGDDRVALYEPNDEHPGGEAFVGGPLPVEVAETPMVLLRIREGELEKLSKTQAQKIQKEYDTKRFASARAEQANAQAALDRSPSANSSASMRAEIKQELQADFDQQLNNTVEKAVAAALGKQSNPPQSPIKPFTSAQQKAADDAAALSKTSGVPPAESTRI